MSLHRAGTSPEGGGHNWGGGGRESGQAFKQSQWGLGGPACTWTHLSNWGKGSPQGGEGWWWCETHKGNRFRLWGRHGAGAPSPGPPRPAQSSPRR